MFNSVMTKIRKMVHRVPLGFSIYLWLCYFPYSVIKKWLLLGNEGLTDEQKAFIERNRRKWSEFDNNKSVNDRGYVLIDSLVHFPNPHLLTNSIIGKYLGKKQNLKTLFLLMHRYDTRARKICESYGSDGFIYLHYKKLNPLVRITSLIDTLRILQKTKTGDELAVLEYKGLLIGDVIYDTYLRKTREGTIQGVGRKLFKHIYDGVMTRNYLDRIFRRYKIAAIVLGGLEYSDLGILSRVSVNLGVRVYVRNRRPSDSIRLRYYGDIQNVHNSVDRPTEALVDYIYHNHREEAVKDVESYLQHRMNVTPTDLPGGDEPLAYGQDKIILDRTQLINQYNLDAKKPIAVIMSHVYIDAVHVKNWMLFRDYLTWLRETLNFIKSCPDTNWFIKPHPSNEAYQCKQNDKEEMAKVSQGLEGHTIRLLSNEINTKSLLEFADVLITVSGTAGLEFSCFGIPCILAGESFYSGFDFTIEPKTKEEYFTLLSNISKIKKLGQEQIERAKVVAYIIFRLMAVKTKFLSDDMPTANMPILGELNIDMIWRELYDSITNIDPPDDSFYKNFMQFLDSNNTHLLNRPEFYTALSEYSEGKT